VFCQLRPDIFDVMEERERMLLGMAHRAATQPAETL